MGEMYRVGIDIGSTTIKAVVLDHLNNRVWDQYRRHHADIRSVLTEMIGQILKQVGEKPAAVTFTGSGSISLAAALGVPFLQEVAAVRTAVRERVPEADVVIELGGEDAKILFLTGGEELRMNGICAGGTGAFLDQMAALMQTDAEGLSEMASGSTQLYPVAARCGVFAKSDVQPLINDGIPRADIAASILQAVVDQTIGGLAQGRQIRGNVVLLGGPLSHMAQLRDAFARTLGEQVQIILPEKAHLFAAGGAALRCGEQAADFSGILARLMSKENLTEPVPELPPLFRTKRQKEAFDRKHQQAVLPRRSLQNLDGDCYLGIDAGSTTLKMVLISEKAELLWSFYEGNGGDPLETARRALLSLYDAAGEKVRIRRSCSTGYGERLMQKAFRMDDSQVETIAHYRAATYFEPEADSILDIGGQDMKFIRIRNHTVDSIVLNEACSSGCGSFLENLAQSLNLSPEEFSRKALQSRHPVDLGTRCTVFMNSNVKHAQKEGVPVEDIAAGLAYSVVKNALFKVIKMTDPSLLGEKILVQGGTFCSDAVLRCLELVSGREVIRPEIASLMGAFGAALIARERAQRFPKGTSTLLTPEELRSFTFSTAVQTCGGCLNRCRLTVNRFPGGGVHCSGNRCERWKGGDGFEELPDLFEYKKKRLFDYLPLSEEEAGRGTIGIPRVLNMYENYPFWAVFFRELGFRVVLSPFSNPSIYRLGMDSIPSESECYPAKLVHGHIRWLVDQGIRTIFYPCIFYEQKEDPTAQNHYNCPMVISYPENIRNNLEDLKEKDIRYLDPFLAFTDEKTLRKRLCRFMKEAFGIPMAESDLAVAAGWSALMDFREDIRRKGRETVEWLEKTGRHGIVLAGRPYHLDPEVNHGIPRMILSCGMAVLTEDSVADLEDNPVKLRVTDQWMYHSRLYRAAESVIAHPCLDFVQLNSFGCGLDAVTADQLRELLEPSGRMYTLLKIDEISNLGAARIRIRSLAAAIEEREAAQGPSGLQRIRPPRDYSRQVYTREMQEEGYTILCTGMAQPHFDFFGAALRSCGYRVVMMKSESPKIREMGLKYVNNDACYPTMIVTGQILEEVLSGRYDTKKLAVMMVQTGGGCRASNYVSFIRKALRDAGQEQIPVISVNANSMEIHGGFRISPRLGRKVMQGMVYGDLLMKLQNRVRPYEQEEGSADLLTRKWTDLCCVSLECRKTDRELFRRNCRGIVQEFDALPIKEERNKPRVCIVGEVLVKYMEQANRHLARTLEVEGAEVVMPGFLEFMEYCFWNAEYRSRYLGGSKLAGALAKALLLYAEAFGRDARKELEKSRHFRPDAKLKEFRELAKEVLQLGNQCGEGWFLAGEMRRMILEGADNIVCVQPFGCLPNHIVGKGIIRRIRELHPEANIVAIDYDPSASAVNQTNRLRLMMETAREKMKKG